MAHVERIAISLSKDLARRVEAERKQTGETRSAFVRRAIEQRLREKARAAKVSAYTEGYRRTPETPAEARASEAAAAQLLAQEPWD